MTLLKGLIDCQKFINKYLSNTPSKHESIPSINRQSNNNCMARECDINIDDDYLKCEKNTITNYECGYCSRYIENPKHMYSDLPFCTLHCRNKQIKSDNMRYDVKNNNNFSF